MGSTRLPGKILMPLDGHSLLEHILIRISGLKHESTLVVATGSSPNDDAVEVLCRRLGVECFRGSEPNVLERYYECAKAYGFEHVVRLTADNPFTDVDELDNLIDLHLSSGSDFSHSLSSLPAGVGAEIFTVAALAKSYCEGKAPHHLEHVDEYLLENPGVFKTSILDVPQSKRRPDIRLTVDTEEDYRKAILILRNSSSPQPSTEEIISLCLRYA